MSEPIGYLLVTRTPLYSYDRFDHPAWCFNDPPALGDIVDPLPELTRLNARWRPIRQRIADVMRVARHGAF